MGDTNRVKVISYKPIIFEKKWLFIDKYFKIHQLKNPEVDLFSLKKLLPLLHKSNATPKEILSIKSQIVLIDTQLDYISYFLEIGRKLDEMGIYSGLITSFDERIREEISTLVNHFSFIFFFDFPLSYIEYKKMKKLAKKALKIVIEGNFFPKIGALTYNPIKSRGSNREILKAIDVERFHFCYPLEKEAKSFRQKNTIIYCPPYAKNIIKGVFPDYTILDGNKKSIEVVRVYWLSPKQFISQSFPLIEKEINNAIYLSDKIIKLMEIRVEAIFRPHQEDVETVYALSGRSRIKPDMLHSLSSGEIIIEADANHVKSYKDGMLETIIEERGEVPLLIVDIHTHPEGPPYLSDADKKYIRAVADDIKRSYPSTQIIFGVHAVSEESHRKREEPKKIADNVIRWCSTTREHQVGFYTKDGLPVTVILTG